MYLPAGNTSNPIPYRDKTSLFGNITLVIPAALKSTPKESAVKNTRFRQVMFIIHAEFTVFVKIDGNHHSTSWNPVNLEVPGQASGTIGKASEPLKRQWDASKLRS